MSVTNADASGASGLVDEDGEEDETGDAGEEEEAIVGNMLLLARFRPI
jgi:hypothetical protein